MQDRHGAVPVALVDRGCQVGQAVGCQLDVEIAEGAGRLPGLSGFGRLLGADARQCAEHVGGIRIDGTQHFLAVLVGQEHRACRAYVVQRGQVGDLTLAVGWIKRQRAAGPKLLPEPRVRFPLASHFSLVSGAQMRDRADQGELFPGAGVLYFQDRVTVVLGAESDAQDLDRSRVLPVTVVEQSGAIHTPKLPLPTPVKAWFAASMI